MMIKSHNDPTTRPSRILVVNDDGIHAPGLTVLEEIARQLCDEVWVVAPESDQSGVSHSISLMEPLRLRRLGERRYAVRGTPTDCVIMGVQNLMTAHPPDLVLSGVNRGHNVAEDVIYSGTVAAAMEGALLGIPSIALSQAYEANALPEEQEFVCAAARGAEIVLAVYEAGIAPGTLVNINFPALPPEAVEGVAVTRQGGRNRKFVEIEARHDGRGHPYYWVVYAHSAKAAETGTDMAALASRRISVTPLKIDLTDESALSRLAQVFTTSA